MIRLFLAVVAGLLILPDFARGDLTVTEHNDGDDGDCTTLHCTLREAVAEADGETIHLGTGTYNLTLGQLSIATSNFTVAGAGARSTTIHSNGNGRVANVDSFSIVTFEGVTVSGGRADAGGAFNVGESGELRLFGVTLTDNRATDRGGAIATIGDLSFTESTASDNRAGTLDATPGLGGAIYIGGGAGSIDLHNSTLSGNIALSGGSGGGVFALDDYSIEFVTIAGNTAGTGGGLYHGDASGHVHSTLIAGNAGGDCAGAPSTLNEDYNLSSDTTCLFTDTGDHSGVDAKIAALANRGGQTDTHALLNGSPALAAADPLSCPDTDQRGIVRPSPGPCAIGAFEGSIVADYHVTLTGDDGNGICSDDPSNCTLRDAVTEAGPGDRVFVPAGTYTLTDALSLLGDQIIGENARTTFIQPTLNLEERVMQAIEGDNRVSGVTIRHGRAIDGGGALVQGPTVSLTLTGVTVSENFAQHGGGVANLGATLDVVRSTITDNFAAEPTTNSGTGAGIHTTGTTRITNSTVTGNTADNGESPAEGGGIYINGGTVLIENVTLVRNRGAGSAIFRETVPASTVTMRNTIVGDAFGVPSCFGPAPAGDHNLVSHSSCGATVKEVPLGELDANGGQTDTFAIGATSPAVDRGATCEPTDQRGLPRKRACDIGAYEFQGNLPPSGGGGGGGQQPPPPPGDKQLPPPEAGKNVNALPASGTVKVKLPGSDKFVELTEGQQLPVGTIVDARKGHVTLLAAGGGDAEFYGGIFKIGQGKGAKPLTTLSLVEKLACPKKKASTAAKRKKKRRLWGDGKGRFRTKGKHSAATVVGTQWLVEDKCRSTLTRVVRGRVSVRDFVKKKTVIVKAGKKYVAKAKP